MVRLRRVHGSLSLNTSQTTYFRQIWRDVQKVIEPECLIIDPFARNCKLEGYKHVTNDYDNRTSAEYHLGGIEFMRLWDTRTADLIIFDPPFSPVQSAKYETVGMKNIYTVPGYIKEIFDEIDRVMKPGSYLLKFGFNSTRHRGTLELVDLWLVNHGANHADTIVTLWKKINHNIEEYV